MNCLGVMHRPSSALVVILCSGFGLVGCGGFFGGSSSKSSDKPIGPVNFFKCSEHNGGATYAPLRRLTNEEYATTVGSLLGIDASDVVKEFGSERRVLGFDNNIDFQSVLYDRAQDYQQVAEALATRALADATARQKLVGCSPSADSNCEKNFIARFARRAFRRAVDSDDLEPLVAIAAAAKSADPSNEFAPVAWVIEAALQSPHFLYRQEYGNGTFDAERGIPLSGAEIATRLSYLILGDGPSDALLDQADAGALSTAQGVMDAATSMLNTEQAKLALHRFTDQWLRMYKLDTASADTMMFPKFNTVLRDSMKTEIHKLMDEYLWTDNQDFLEILTSNHTYVNQPLAALYGTESTPNATTWKKVTHPAQSERAGLLGTAAFLTLTSKLQVTSVVFRGRFVRDVIMCDEMPDPPPDVPQLMVGTQESEGEAVDRHSSMATCQGCHTKLDPIGKGLERYNPIGELRQVDEASKPVATEGEVVGVPNGKFAGAAQLGNLLKQQSSTSQCVTRQLFRWAAGRIEQPEGSADTCTLESLTSKFDASGHNYKQLIINLVGSDAFRFMQRSE